VNNVGIVGGGFIRPDPCTFVNSVRTTPYQFGTCQPRGG